MRCYITMVPLELHPTVEHLIPLTPSPAILAEDLSLDAFFETIRSHAAKFSEDSRLTRLLRAVTSTCPPAAMIDQMIECLVADVWILNQTDEGMMALYYLLARQLIELKVARAFAHPEERLEQKHQTIFVHPINYGNGAEN